MNLHSMERNKIKGMLEIRNTERGKSATCSLLERSETLGISLAGTISVISCKDHFP